MNYPLISEYIEAIKSAEDNFEELSYLRPVLGDDGLPLMTSGNFAVVFKMKDEQNGKFYAVKCFTKEQEGRAEAYREIGKELENVSSPYILSIRYLEKELFVDTDQTAETEFPVLLMEWVEGKTLDKYLRENLDDKYALEMLAYRFSLLAQWLIPQPFAHGDLKPDNILVREDGTLVLVDYDGMYVPAMKGQKARELGSPDFRHPLWTEGDFDEHIDDFSLVSILLSLKAISLNPQLIIDSDNSELLMSRNDYFAISRCTILKELLSYENTELNTLIGMFLVCLSNMSLNLNIQIKEPINQIVFERRHEILSNLWLDIDLHDLCVDNEGAIYSKDFKCLFICPNVKEYIVKNGTETIWEEAFGNCSKLELIILPESIKDIKYTAFYRTYSYTEKKSSNLYTMHQGYEFGCPNLCTIAMPYGQSQKFRLPQNIRSLIVEVPLEKKTRE